MQIFVRFSDKSQYRGTIGTFNNRCQHFKYNGTGVAFGVTSFYCSILTIISIFSLSLSFGIFVCNTIKIFLFSRFRKIKGVFVIVYLLSHFFPRKLFLSVDIETNPGPRDNLNNHFTICHWNLNSFSANNFAKIQLLKAYLAVHKFDIVCLSETYLIL